MIAIWIFTRIIYVLTDGKLNAKQQSGLGFVLGILFIIVLISVEWFSFEFAIPYFVSFLLLFVLDVTQVTNRRGKKKESINI